jgi:hypothetical protein
MRVYHCAPSPCSLWLGAAARWPSPARRGSDVIASCSAGIGGGGHSHGTLRVRLPRRVVPTSACASFSPNAGVLRVTAQVQVQPTPVPPSEESSLLRSADDDADVDADADADAAAAAAVVGAGASRGGKGVAAGRPKVKVGADRRGTTHSLASPGAVGWEQEWRQSQRPPPPPPPRSGVDSGGGGGGDGAGVGAAGCARVAREALARGDVEAARTSLRRGLRLDVGHPELRSLPAEIKAAAAVAAAGAGGDRRRGEARFNADEAHINETVRTGEYVGTLRWDHDTAFQPLPSCAGTLHGVVLSGWEDYMGYRIPPNENGDSVVQPT